MTLTRPLRNHPCGLIRSTAISSVSLLYCCTVSCKLTVLCAQMSAERGLTSSTSKDSDLTAHTPQLKPSRSICTVTCVIFIHYFLPLIMSVHCALSRSITLRRSLKFALISLNNSRLPSLTVSPRKRLCEFEINRMATAISWLFLLLGSRSSVFLRSSHPVTNAWLCVTLISTLTTWPDRALCVSN